MLLSEGQQGPAKNVCHDMHEVGGDQMSRYSYDIGCALP